MAQRTPHTVDIVISPTGDVEATVKGVAGPSCGKLTDWLETLGDVVEHHKTPDYSRQQQRGTVRKVGGGC